MSNDKPTPVSPEDAAQGHQPPWVAEIGRSLDQSLAQLDTQQLAQLAKRREQVLQLVRRKRQLRRAGWVGMAAAAGLMTLMLLPSPERLQLGAPAGVEDMSQLLQELELLEDMDMLSALGEVPEDA